MTKLSSIRAVASGHVQGVLFRAFVAEHARELGLMGQTRNLPSGVEVEVLAEGERTKLERLTEFLKAGPPSATVEEVTVTWGNYTGKYSSFSIIPY